MPTKRLTDLDRELRNDPDYEAALAELEPYEEIARQLVVFRIESGLSQVTHQSPLLVIDGQQRLTTVSLLLAALAKAVGDGEPFDGFSRRKIRNYYLLNPEESGERHFKLLLSQTDKASLTAIVGDDWSPLLSSSSLVTLRQILEISRSRFRTPASRV